MKNCTKLVELIKTMQMWFKGLSDVHWYNTPTFIYTDRKILVVIDLSTKL